MTTNSEFNYPLKSRSNQYVDHLLPVFLGLLLNFSKRALFSTIKRQMTFFCKQRRIPHPHKKVFKILPLRQIATQRCNFETHAMMDSRSYGQHSHEIGSRNRKRRQKAANHFYSYKWKKLRLIKDALYFFWYKWSLSGLLVLIYT